MRYLIRGKDCHNGDTLPGFFRPFFLVITSEYPVNKAFRACYSWPVWHLFYLIQKPKKHRNYGNENQKNNENDAQERGFKSQDTG